MEAAIIAVIHTKYEEAQQYTSGKIQDKII